MQTREDRCRELFGRWYNSNISAEEQNELWELLAEADEQGQLEPMMRDAYEQMQVEPFLDKQRIEQMAVAITGKPAKIKRIIPARWIAAASVLILLGLSGYLLVLRKDTVTKPENGIAVNDVEAPETNRATVRLSDGRTVFLDSAQNGQLAMQGSVKVLKLDDGQVLYQSTGEPVSEMSYNTLTNPIGSQSISMTLSDGSNVWLNAGSSVTYPVSFIGSERKVSVTGEAYFEVASDKTKPFIVSKRDMEVEVLGTHFNVNAYDDEGEIRVTLLEGSVKVSGNGKASVIRPGQQALIREGTTGISIKDDVFMDKVMGWKSNNFIFYNDDINTIMRQLARWYNVEVKFNTKNMNEHYSAAISRTNNVSAVLKILQSVGGIHFTIENNVITVLD